MKRFQLFLADVRNGRPVISAPWFFLAIAAPTLLILSFLIGPFEAADEPAHYLRVVAIAEGRILPEMSPPSAPKKAAGAYLDSAVAGLAGRAQDVVGYGQHHYSVLELKQKSGIRETGARVFAPHSNTAIYPPLLYMPSAAATFLARAAGLPPLWWLYLGRLANVLIAIFIIHAALRRAGDAQLLLFASALLPMTLFQIASVSADALLFPLVIAFAVLLLRVARGESRGRFETASLAAAMIFVCTGKIAFLPLAFLPALAARLADRHWSRRALWLAGAGLFAFLLWMAWALTVREMVFSIRPDVEIDPMLQLQQLVAKPLQSMAFFAQAMLGLSPKLVIGLVGTRLGWGELLLPSWLIYALPFCLAAAALPAEQPQRRFVVLTVGATAAAAAAYCAIFLLIYLQFNEVGSTEVIGVQGRYFWPLAVLLLALTPRLRVTAARMARIWALAAMIGSATATVTLAYVGQRYW